MNESQTNTNTTVTPPAQPQSQAAPSPAPVKPIEKWYESRQIQAAFITGVVSLVINLLNILAQKIR